MEILGQAMQRQQAAGLGFDQVVWAVLRKVTRQAVPRVPDRPKVRLLGRLGAPRFPPVGIDGRVRGPLRPLTEVIRQGRG